MRGIVLMARESWDEALHVLDELHPEARDEEVAYWSLRNGCAARVTAGRALELEVLLPQLAATSERDVAPTYFWLENRAAAADALGCRKAFDEMASRSHGQDMAFWTGVLDDRAPALAQALGVPAAELFERIRDLGS